MRKSLSSEQSIACPEFILFKQRCARTFRTLNVCATVGSASFSSRSSMIINSGGSISNSSSPLSWDAMIECEGDVYILTESARGKHAGGGTLRRVVARQLSRRYNFVLKMNDISSTHSAPRVCVCVPPPPHSLVSTEARHPRPQLYVIYIGDGKVLSGHKLDKSIQYWQQKAASLLPPTE